MVGRLSDTVAKCRGYVATTTNQRGLDFNDASTTSALAGLIRWAVCTNRFFWGGGGVGSVDGCRVVDIGDATDLRARAV